MTERLKDADWLRREYIDRGRAAPDIAAEVGCGATTVRRWMRRHGIGSRLTTAKDETGNRYGRLVVIERASNDLRPIDRRDAWWWCRCDCGESTLIPGKYLREGHVRSCGCFQREGVSARFATHGLSGHSLYKTWTQMHERCRSPKNNSYGRYGGRGITVCERWSGREGFPNFIADMGEKPGPEYTLDRYPDNDGNYEPGNCRWATPKEQAANRRPQARN